MEKGKHGNRIGSYGIWEEICFERELALLEEPLPFGKI